MNENPLDKKIETDKEFKASLVEGVKHFWEPGEEPAAEGAPKSKRKIPFFSKKPKVAGSEPEPEKEGPEEIRLKPEVKEPAEEKEMETDIDKKLDKARLEYARLDLKRSKVNKDERGKAQKDYLAVLKQKRGEMLERVEAETLKELEKKKAKKTAKVEKKTEIDKESYLAKLKEQIKKPEKSEVEIIEEIKQRKAGEIIKETVVREALRLAETKVDLGTRVFTKKITKPVVEVIKFYRKMPLWWKISMGGALLSIGVGGGMAGGALGAALVGGSVAGRWMMRSLSGAGTYMGLEALIKRAQEKKAEKKTLEGFANDLLSIIRDDNKKLDEKLFKLEGAKKRQRYLRHSLAFSSAALVSSGWVLKEAVQWGHWAEKIEFGKLLRGALGLEGAEQEVVEKAAPGVEPKPESIYKGPRPMADLDKIEKEAIESGVTKEGAPSGVSSYQAEESGVSSEEVRSGVSEAPKVPAAEAPHPEVAPVPAAAEFIETAQKGDSIWEMAEREAAKYYGEKWNSLGSDPKSPGKIYLIDAIKDRIVADLKTFGLENADQIKIGQKIDFSQIFQDKPKMDGFFKHAVELVDHDKINIIKDGLKIDDWTDHHPGQPLTTERVHEILSGGIVEEAAKATTEASPGVPNLQIYPDEIWGDKITEIVQQEHNLLKAIGLNPTEFKIMKDITVEKLLEQIPSEGKAWSLWESQGSKAFDLPHQGDYWKTQFGRYVDLAEYVRGLNPSAVVKKMTLSDFIRRIAVSRLNLIIKT